MINFVIGLALCSAWCVLLLIRKKWRQDIWQSEDIDLDFERDSICPKCDDHRDWVECEACGGKGGRDGDDLMEEDPHWYGEDDFEECDICEGVGYFWVCHQCAKKSIPGKDDQEAA